MIGQQFDNQNQDFLEEITTQYESQLYIPTKKPQKQFFLCPVGLIGSGKTTVLKALSEELGLLRISGDEIRVILKERGLGYDATWEIGRRLVEKYAWNGYSIAHDTDCATPKTIEYVTKLSKEIGVQVVWIHLNTPEEFILDNLRNFRHNRQIFKDGEQAVENYMVRKELHSDLPMNFLYTFDISRPDIDAQIQEALYLIRNKTQKQS